MNDAEEEWEVKEAQEEHLSLSRVPLCTPAVELTQYVGSGAAWYFRFVKYLWLIDLELLLVALLSVIPHLANLPDQKPAFPEILYLSSYTEDTRPFWQASSILAVIICFLQGYCLMPCRLSVMCCSQAFVQAVCGKGTCEEAAWRGCRR